MIPAFPFDPASVVSNLPQSVYEFIDGRGTRQREHRFNVSNAVKAQFLRRLLSIFQAPAGNIPLLLRKN